MPTILLTGATGFLGSHILHELVLNGFDVVIALREKSDILRIKDIIDKVKVYRLNEATIGSIFDQNNIDGVIHTACNYARPNTSIKEILNSNVIFGLNIVEEAVRTKVKFFINTDTLLPANLNYYALSKNQFVIWLKTFTDGIKIINVRIEHMYGCKDDSNKFIYWFLNEALHSTKTINLTSGLQKRDFIYIDDVTSAYLLILKNITNFENWTEFDIGTGLFVTVKSFIQSIVYALQKYKNIDVTSRLNFGAIPYRDNEIMSPILDNSRLIQLGWKPEIGLEKGIEKIIKNI